MRMREVVARELPMRQLARVFGVDESILQNHLARDVGAR